MKMILKVEGPQGSGRTRLLEAIASSLKGWYRVDLPLFDDHEAVVEELDQPKQSKQPVGESAPPTDAARTKQALDFVLGYLQRHIKGVYAELADGVEAILNPPPETEDLEIVRWECPKCGMVNIDDTVFLDHSCEVVATDLIKLTGTVQRPKPQPVEKSVSKGCTMRADGVITTVSPTPIQPFMQHPECHGKAGILTFTWQETPK